MPAQRCATISATARAACLLSRRPTRPTQTSQPGQEAEDDALIEALSATLLEELGRLKERRIELLIRLQAKWRGFITYRRWQYRLREIRTDRMRRKVINTMLDRAVVNVIEGAKKARKQREARARLAKAKGQAMFTTKIKKGAVTIVVTSRYLRLRAELPVSVDRVWNWKVESRLE